VPKLSRIPLDTDRGRRPDIRPWFRRRPGLPGEGDGEHPPGRRAFRKDFGGQPGIWAYSESPLVDGDAVVVTPGGTAATLVALNKENRRDTLEVRGSRRRAGRIRFRCPRRTLAASSSMCNSCRRAWWSGRKDGQIPLAARTQPRRGPWRDIPTPIVHDGRVYTAFGHVRRRTGARKSPGRAHSNVEPKYFRRSCPTPSAGPSSFGDNLYGATNSTVMCVDFASGEVKWEERSVGAGSLCAADGELYLMERMAR